MSGATKTTTATLLRVLDEDPDRAADKYEELFLRLRRFFRSRHRSTAEDLAQETLRRGFSRILAGAEIYVDPAHYFFAIARNVAIEQWRAAPPESTVATEDLPDTRMVDFESVEARICLDQCLQYLRDDERELLLRYQSEDHEALAQDLGMTHGTLRVSAHRAKKKLALLMRQAIAARAPAETKPRVAPFKE